MLDEPIHLEPHHPHWEAEFRQEQNRIATGLGVSPVVIEHIGSTAVSGLLGKPDHPADKHHQCSSVLDEISESLSALPELGRRGYDGGQGVSFCGIRRAGLDRCD